MASNESHTPRNGELSAEGARLVNSVRFTYVNADWTLPPVRGGRQQNLRRRSRTRPEGDSAQPDELVVENRVAPSRIEMGRGGRAGRVGCDDRVRSADHVGSIDPTYRADWVDSMRPSVAGDRDFVDSVGNCISAVMTEDTLRGMEEGWVDGWNGSVQSIYSSQASILSSKGSYVCNLVPSESDADLVGKDRKFEKVQNMVPIQTSTQMKPTYTYGDDELR